jgi:hypothetical protein
MKIRAIMVTSEKGDKMYRKKHPQSAVESLYQKTTNNAVMIMMITM